MSTNRLKKRPTLTAHELNGHAMNGHAGTNGHAKKGHGPSPLDAVGDGAAAAAAKEPPKDGRDESGRFAVGNKFACGNPFARKVAALRSALVAGVTEQDITAVVARLVASAKDGDVAAAKLLLAYAIGQPAPAVDPDALDVAEWQLLERQPSAAEVLRALIDTVPAGVAVEMLRGVLPTTIAAAKDKIICSAEDLENDEDAQEFGFAPDPKVAATIEGLDAERQRRRKGARP